MKQLKHTSSKQTENSVCIIESCVGCIGGKRARQYFTNVISNMDEFLIKANFCRACKSELKKNIERTFKK